MDILGVDVSKAKLDCYLSHGIERKAIRQSTFQVENSEDGFECLKAKLSKQGIGIECLRIVLEPTSRYHLRLVAWLYQHEAEICLINPGDARYFAKSLGICSKSDNLDCFVLAQFGQTRQLVPWKPQSETLRKLDELSRIRLTIVRSRCAVENRISELPKDGSFDTTLRYQQATLKHFKEQENAIDKEILELIESDKTLRQKQRLLMTCPGVGKVLATYFLILFETKKFSNGEQIAAYCGVVPREYQSGSSVHAQSRMTKRGKGYIRAALRMGATAITSKNHKSPLRDYYEWLLMRGKNKPCALGVLMHKLVLVTYAIWRKDRPYEGGKNVPIAA